MSARCFNPSIVAYSSQSLRDCQVSWLRERTLFYKHSHRLSMTDPSKHASYERQDCGNIKARINKLLPVCDSVRVAAFIRKKARPELRLFPIGFRQLIAQFREIEQFGRLLRNFPEIAELQQFCASSQSSKFLLDRTIELIFFWFKNCCNWIK